ncbi:diphthine synthase [Candidatus Woesearchaeota archaeon]|nr:diphthine synthase [Candidatus Woesearchaeota archaeon]
MPLHLIGIGLNYEKDISVRGLEIVKKCDLIYLETYSSVLACSLADLEKFYGKKIIPAGRELVEQSDEIVDNAIKKEVALLVIGDPLSATTHIDIMLRARKKGVLFNVINNASILTSVGIAGLQIYKFGKTSSVPFPDMHFQPVTAYEVVKQNRILGLHTMLILDLRPAENKFMTVNQAIEILLGIERHRQEQLFTEDTLCVGCARIGRGDFFIKAGSAKDLLSVDFGSPPHCLLVPGELHFIEEEALEAWKLKE